MKSQNFPQQQLQQKYPLTGKRSRGRPKGSKNKISSKPKKVTMECGSQTDMTSITDYRYSSDSDVSGGDDSRPPKPILMVPSAVSSEERRSRSSSSAEKSMRRRPPRKDGPPTLEIQQKPSISSSCKAKKSKNCELNLMADLGVKTRVSPPVANDLCSHEVIILDSDDNFGDDVVEDERRPIVQKTHSPPTPATRSGQGRQRRRQRHSSSTSNSCSFSEDSGSGVEDCVQILRSSPPTPESKKGSSRPTPTKAIVVLGKKKFRDKEKTKKELNKKRRDCSSISETRGYGMAESPPIPLHRGQSATTSSNFPNKELKKSSGRKKKRRRRRRRRNAAHSVKSRRSATPIATSDRDSSSRSPSRTSPTPSRRLSRQEAFLSSVQQQQRPESRSSSTFSLTSGEVVAVFDKRFSTKTPDDFWTPSPSPVRSVVNVESDAAAAPAAHARQRRKRRPSSSTESTAAARTAAVQTKGSLKEMPPSSFFHQSSFVGCNAGGGASTKTMLSVLAETNKKGKPGRKRRKGRRSCSNDEWSDKPEEGRRSSKNQQLNSLQQQQQQQGVSPVSSSHSSKSPFSPRSNPCSEGSGYSGHRYSDILDCSEGYKKSASKKKEKRNMQRWRSKHNNVTDPVLLGHVENLIQDMYTCQLERAISRDYWPARPRDSVPSIFKKRKILSTRQREEGRAGAGTKRSKKRNSLHSTTAAEVIITDPQPPPPPPATLSSSFKASEEAEQRLPLKKRHHHHHPVDSASPECVIVPPSVPKSKRLSSLGDPLADKSGVKAAEGAKSGRSVASDDVHIVFDSNKKQPSRRNSRTSSNEGAKGQKVKKHNRRPSSQDQTNFDENGTRDSTGASLTCGDKLTVKNAAAPKSLMTPLSIDTHDPSALKSAASARAVTPRKRHLMEMQMQNALQGPEEPPPMLEKAPSPTLPLLLTQSMALPQMSHSEPSSKDSQSAPQAAVPYSQSETIQIAASPPRLSPQGFRAGAAFNTAAVASADPDDADSSAAIATPVTAARMDEMDSPPAPAIGDDDGGTWLAVQRSRKVLSAKYSDISDDSSSSSSSSVSSLKLRLRRERAPPQDMEAAFTRLQESITEKEKKKEVAPEDTKLDDLSSLPYISSDDDPLLPTLDLESKAAGKGAVPFETKRSGKDGRRKGEDQLTRTKCRKKPLCAVSGSEEAEERHEDEQLPRQRARRPSQKQREANESLVNDKQPVKIVKPHILKGRSQKTSEEKPVTLQRCSVRVHKLTEQEIFESSPSPPSFSSDSPMSNPTEETMPTALSISTSVRIELKTMCPFVTTADEPLSRCGVIAAQIRDEKEEKSVEHPECSFPTHKKRKRRSNKTGFPSNKRKKRTQSADGPGAPSSVPAAPRPKPRKPKFADANKVPLRASSRIISIDGDKRAAVTAAPTGGIKKDEQGHLLQSEEISPFTLAPRYNDIDPVGVGGGSDILSQAISQIVQEQQQEQQEQKKHKQQKIGEKRRKSADSEMKRPRGRPPKKKSKMIDCVDRHAVSSTEESLSRDNTSLQIYSSSETVLVRKAQAAINKSYIDEGADDEMDCLSLLPPLSSNCESGLSSETPSGAETEDNSRSSSSNRRRKATSSSMFKKKTSLKAGLFADSYKDGREELVAAGGSSERRSLWYRPAEHPHGLLPPPYYCGRKLRERTLDFQLPYDLWWMHANKQLPGRDVAATWNYKKISRNYYFDVKPVPHFENQSCQCAPPQDPMASAGCGEECINRMTYAECDPKLCPLGEYCSNNAIQKHRGVTSSLERFMTEKKGWGIKTKTSIVSGQFITEYVGEIVSEKVFKHRMVTDYVGDTHHYCLHLDGGTVIDGHRMGGECRFVNHSCEPNCEIQKWTVGGHYRMALFSLKDIAPGEELTYDYNFSLFNPHEGQSCQCLSAKCRGVIGGRSQRLINGKFDANCAAAATAGGRSINNTAGNNSRGGCGSSGGGPNDKSESGCKKRSRVPRIKRSDSGISTANRLNLLAPMKPMSLQQQNYVRLHRCFLLRNLEKVRRVRESVQRKVTGQIAARGKEEEAVATRRPAEMILTGLTALATARSMQTRRLTIAQDDPSVTKVVKLAQLLREIFAQITTVDGKYTSPHIELYILVPLKSYYAAGSWRSDEFEALGDPL